METVVASYSGGLDSTVLLWLLKEQGYRVETLSVDYGQRHRRELDSAATCLSVLGWAPRVVDLRSVASLFGNNALTSAAAVPDGHYADESMKATVVPNRNALLLTLASSLAISLGGSRVAYAAHSGDHAIYPDCRPEFRTAISQLFQVSDYQPVTLLTPFLDRTKAEIVRLGYELGVPFELTWSCYRGGDRHCGRCGTCYERREAFTLAGVPDPTEYTD